jgi:hypothetical protein
MATKEVEQMSADALFTRWRVQYEVIYTESLYLFTNKYRFVEVQKLFQDNARLGKLGGDVYGWLAGAWPFAVVEAIWALVAFRRWWYQRTPRSAQDAGGPNN